MGLKDVSALERLNEELSSDEPSPGGGTASAAAGSMAASLLIMVCRLTARSKKHERDRPELDRLMRELTDLRGRLTELAAQDAEAYDRVVAAARDRRATTTPETERAHQEALRHAADVPMATASACLEVLKRAEDVSIIGLRSASSDIMVAILLARAGFEGAAANVRINLEGITDAAYVEDARSRLAELSSAAEAVAPSARAGATGR